MDKRTTEDITRKQSLLRLNVSDDDGPDDDDGVSLSDGDDLEQQLMKDRDR